MISQTRYFQPVKIVDVELSEPIVGASGLQGYSALHGLVRLLGFGGQDHPYAAIWTREIGAYPVETVKRLLYDLPGAGRAEFSLPPLPALFLWARQDVVSAYPRPLRKSDHLIAGAHSAPLLSAEEIAREVVCFCN